MVMPIDVAYADGGEDASPPSSGGEQDSKALGGDIAPDSDEPQPNGQSTVDETYEKHEVFEPGYDDTWTEDFPQVVDGYNVRHIRTPKSMACLSVPIVAFQTTKPSLDAFLADPPDYTSLIAALENLPEFPDKFTLSFAPGQVDKKEEDRLEADWNRRRVEDGCLEPW